MGSSDLPEPLARYGFSLALVAFMVGVFLSAIFGGIYGAITGAELDSYGVSIAGLFGLWAGTAGVPVYASKRWGTGDLARDYGLAIDWRRDVPLGGAIGLAGQLLVVPGMVALFKLFEPDLKLSEASVDLAERSHGAGFILLVVLVSLVAPVIEELFFRGLLQRSLTRYLPQWAAVGVAGLLFGLAHYQGASAAAAAALVLSLAIFGWAAGALLVRTGRLGPAIVAHMVFNIVASIGIFADSVHKS